MTTVISRIAAVFAACVLAFCVVGCAGGAPSSSASASNAAGVIQARGSIVAADNASLAETQDAHDGKGVRAYPLGTAASPLVGSCYTQDAPEGIEQVYADQLLAGKDVKLTIDSRMQQAAFDALGNRIGAAVVMDPQTGAVLAMVSTPAYDPSATKASGKVELADRAIERHIPGSTFKTVTLAAALELGLAKLDDLFMAPSSLTFAGGFISNYDNMQYDDQTLSQAYAKSINTVFAQLALVVGLEDIANMARRLGFDQEALADFPSLTSLICGIDEMKPLMEAWTGVGQALYQNDGELQGPVMTPVQGAAIASAVINGGKAVRPHVVAAIGGDAMAPAEGEQAMSPETAGQIADCMRRVVTEGTGRSAAVAGVDVGGKTGTAETGSGADDGWFIGFAEDPNGGACYALSVMVEGTAGAEASAVASDIVKALFR